jgi:hypothetical protein
MESLNDIKNVIMEFTRKFADYTEDYARIAKFTLEIQKIKYSMKKKYEETGKHAIGLFRQGLFSFENDNFIIKENDELKEMEKLIVEKNSEIDAIRTKQK